jgi:hypothetical protein
MMGMTWNQKRQNYSANVRARTCWIFFSTIISNLVQSDHSFGLDDVDELLGDHRSSRGVNTAFDLSDSNAHRV